MLKRATFFLIIILLLALNLRLVYLREVAGYPNFRIPYAGLDAALYQALGERIAGGDILLGKEVYHYPPLYAYFLGGLYAVFGESCWVPRLANIVLGVVTVALVYFFTLRLFQSTGAALIAALGSALYGPYLVFDTSSLKVTLGQFLTALSLLLISRASQSRGFIPWLYTGLALGLAANIRGNLGLFLVCLTLWLLLKKSNRQADEPGTSGTESLKGRVYKAGSLIVGFSLAVLPFTLRNFYVAKDPVLITSTVGIHLYIGNHEGAWGGYSEVKGIRPNPAGHFHDAKRVAEKEVGHPLTASEVSGFWKEKAFDYIRGNPTEFLLLLGKKTLLLLNAYEMPNNEDYQYLTQRSPYLSMFPGIGILLPLGFAGLLTSLAEFRSLAPLLIFFFSYAGAVVFSIVTWRYRLPLTLALWPLAAFWLVKVVQWIRQRKFQLLGFSIAALIGTCWLARIPLIPPENYANSIKMAEGRMGACAYENALWKRIEVAATGMKGESTKLWAQLAELRRRQYDLEGAIEILKLALRRNPEQPELWRILSPLLLLSGDPETANEHPNFIEHKPSPSRATLREPSS